MLKEYALCYILLWRNAWDQPKENYASAPGKATEHDFRKFYEDRHTLFLNDIKKLLKFRKFSGLPQADEHVGDVRNLKKQSTIQL